MQRNATTRTVAVINSLLRAGQADVGVRELAGQLQLSRSTTHRVLATLAELGAARTLDGGRYEDHGGCLVATAVPSSREATR
jgi:DNA-binding IclR family transcriptional regulator